MKNIRILILAGSLSMLASGVDAASFSRASESSLAILPADPAGAACGTALLTQSSSQAIVVGNSVSCNIDGAVHVENSYYRAYDLAAYPDGFNVCAVEVGIDRASSATGTQPITVNLYANTGGAFPSGTRALLASSSLTVPDQTATVMTAPIAANVPAGAQMVLEVLTPDGQAAGNSFFIGSNSAGQVADTYLRAPNCGVFSPTSNIASGFPGMQIVLNARGAPAPGMPMITVVPLSLDFGAVLLGQTETRSVQFRNNGTAVLNVSSISTPPLPFRLISDACSRQSLAVNASCTIVYAFSPLSSETLSTSLMVTSNAEQMSIDLHGSGVLALPLPGPRPLALLTFSAAVLLLAGWRLRMH